MYFRGQLGIDPTQSTEIHRAKPERAFAKMLHWMSAGLTSKKEEHETFTALSILQSLNLALRSLEIDNVVRLAKDDFDVYVDNEGREDDLKEALQRFRDTVDPIESEVFQTLTLVVEYKDRALTYLIEFQVHRTHPVGAPPVTAIVNAVATSMRAGADESPDALKSRISDTFASQSSYDGFVAGHRAAFEAFIEELELAIRKHLPVDSISKKVDQRIIRPSQTVHSRPSVRKRGVYDDPIYYDYYGFGDAFLYSYLWSSMCHAHSIHVQDVKVVDASGDELMAVGSEGLDAGASATLDPEQEFTVPDDDPASVPPADMDLSHSDSGESDGSSSFWGNFSDAVGDLGDSISDGIGDFSGSFSSSCSSCSSGSSCSSCGGCGGG